MKSRVPPRWWMRNWRWLLATNRCRVAFITSALWRFNSQVPCLHWKDILCYVLPHTSSCGLISLFNNKQMEGDFCRFPQPFNFSPNMKYLNRKISWYHYRFFTTLVPDFRLPFFSPFNNSPFSRSLFNNRKLDYFHFVSPGKNCYEENVCKRETFRIIRNLKANRKLLHNLNISS